MKQKFHDDQVAHKKKCEEHRQRALQEIKSHFDRELIRILQDEVDVKAIIDMIEEWMQSHCSAGFDISAVRVRILSRNQALQEANSLYYMYHHRMDSVQEMIVSAEKVVKDIATKYAINPPLDSDFSHFGRRAFQIEVAMKVCNYVLREWNMQHKDLILEIEEDDEGLWFQWSKEKNQD